MAANRADTIARALRDAPSRRAVLGLGLGGMLATVFGRYAPPAAAQEAPFVYYAGATAEGMIQVGGALFSDIPPYIFVFNEPGGAAIGVHYILSAEVWEYEGTWQFVTSTPYLDCSPYEGGFIQYVSGYDPGRNLYSNLITIDVCGGVG